MADHQPHARAADRDAGRVVALDVGRDRLPGVVGERHLRVQRVERGAVARPLATDYVGRRGAPVLGRGAVARRQRHRSQRDQHDQRRPGEAALREQPTEEQRHRGQRYEQVARGEDRLSDQRLEPHEDDGDEQPGERERDRPRCAVARQQNGGESHQGEGRDGQDPGDGSRVEVGLEPGRGQGQEYLLLGGQVRPRDPEQLARAPRRREHRQRDPTHDGHRHRADHPPPGLPAPGEHHQLGGQGKDGDIARVHRQRRAHDVRDPRSAPARGIKHLGERRKRPGDERHHRRVAAGVLAPEHERQTDGTEDAGRDRDPPVELAQPHQ